MSIQQALLAVFLVVLTPLAAPQAEDASDAAQTCLAQTAYFEARGQPRAAMEAVASVVVNRVKDSEFPDSVCAVVQQQGPGRGCQFGWYCDGRPDRAEDKVEWSKANSAAEAVLAGKADPTEGALYFRPVDVNAGWENRLQRTTTIEPFVFYKAPEERASAGDEGSDG